MKAPWHADLIPILQLGAEFYDQAVPAEFPLQKLRYWNDQLNLHLPKENFCNFNPLTNNLKAPLALRYHGHQFQNYNPQLGDGRGFLFAQFKINSQWYDLGTKGSGTTMYSRSGDGRLTLKGAVREALATEMLESLGVTTSKTLCFFETGEKLTRGDEPSPTRSAVLTRLSLGHIRFGTFQRLAFLSETENIKKLVSYCLEFYFKKQIAYTLPTDETEQVNLFLQLVCDRQAKLAAEVMMAGFVHGVLNTDNMNISGELFDYGPYRFLSTYDPDFTAAYFDHEGLYAYGRQPTTFLWNLHELAKSLQYAFPELQIDPTLQTFSTQFNEQLATQFLKRLNLQPLADTPTTETISLFFQFMDENKLPFEKTIFDFHSFNLQRLEKSKLKNFYKGPVFKKLKNALQKYEIADLDKASLSYFKQDEPETLLIDEIESIWRSIDQHDDWSLFENKLKSMRAFRGVYADQSFLSKKM